MELFNYFRSSASYRVRIALALKGLDYDYRPVHLARNEQTQESYAAVSASRLVPLLRDGDAWVTQSMAIIEYLEETHPEPPLLPGDPLGRARVRALAQDIACEIHPLNNLRVLQFFEHEWNVPQPEREEWVRHWIAEGFAGFERMLADNPSTGGFCEGDVPSMADCLLVPQVYNAQRFGLDLEPYPTIRRINAACLALPAFDAARPERQPDAPTAA